MSHLSVIPSRRFTIEKLKRTATLIAQSRAAQITGAGCGGIFFLLQVLVCAVLISGYDEIRKEPDKRTYFLRSSAPFHAVRIPFDLRDGKIILPGELSGKTLQCQYDTGCAETLWSKKLHLAGRKTSRTRAARDMADKNSSLMEVILPTLRLGAYEVRQQSTWVMESKPASKNMVEDAVRDYPILSNEVFRNVVVTIDYHTKELIVRTPDYDFTRQPMGENARVVPFTRVSKGGLYGQPCIEAQINGVTARAVVDTGCVGGIWMNSRFVKVIERETKRAMESIAAPATDYKGNQQKLYCVQMRLGKNTRAISNLTAQIHPKINVQTDYDALAGHAILRYFRITIDYPRQKILLEPFGENIIQTVPKGTLVTIKQKGRVVFKRRFASEVTVFRYADGTSVITYRQ